MNIGAARPKGRTAFVLNPAIGETVPALTWQLQPNGIQYLSARFSIPRQRWGHNARLPTNQVDLFAGLGIAAGAIYRATGIRFNPLEANVTEVHYTLDVPVGRERIRPILDRLELRQLPGHARIRFDHGVEFKRRQSATQIYSKFPDVITQVANGHIRPEYHSEALAAADGVLRIEYRQHAPAIDRSQARRGKRRIGGEVLTMETCNINITETFERLQLSDAITNAENDRDLDRLIECYGVNVAMRLSGFLLMIRSYGVDFWRVLKYPRRTYYDNLRLCRAAGVFTIG